VLGAFIILNPSHSQASQLSSYITLDLVDDDVDGSDFGWISGSEEQAGHPSLANVTLGNISGTFVEYPVELRSTIRDSSGYSYPDTQAQIQRGLRNSERGDWNTLYATLFIKNDETAKVYVIPYLDIPRKGKAYLGFGQVVPTNTWTLITWREIVDSTLYREDFLDEILSLREKYEIVDWGHLRLAHVLSETKIEGTDIGFLFRLLSDKEQGQMDVFSGEIYISSVTFFQN
jgi:hypothetical protein